MKARRNQKKSTRNIKKKQREPVEGHHGKVLKQVALVKSLPYPSYDIIPGTVLRVLMKKIRHVKKHECSNTKTQFVAKK